MKEQVKKEKTAKLQYDLRGNMRKPLFLDGALIAIFAALMAVCAWIAVPLPGGVSVTLQTFAVFFAVGVLGWKRGTISVLVYILLGAVGVPVFTGFKGGVGALLGVTGGYIVGFIGSAVVSGIVCDKCKNKFVFQFLGMVAGLVLCYAIGTVWFYFLYTKTQSITILGVLSSCVFPFIIPDLVKIVLACVLTNRLRARVKF